MLFFGAMEVISWGKTKLGKFGKNLGKRREIEESKKIFKKKNEEFKVKWVELKSERSKE